MRNALSFFLIRKRNHIQHPLTNTHSHPSIPNCNSYSCR